MHRRPNSESSSDGMPYKDKAYNQDFDDRIHNVHRRDDNDFLAALSLMGHNVRRSRRVLSIIGLLFAILLFWSYWWRPRYAGPDWSKFAYVQYAVDDHNLCNSLMVFDSLKRSGSRAKRVLLYHNEWATQENGGRDKNAELLSTAQQKYKVELRPIKPLDSRGEISLVQSSDSLPTTFDTSVTKLRAFELTQYNRLVVLDSDITLFKNVDELFTLPKTPIAMPRAYWLTDDDNANSKTPLTSHIMVLEPNPSELRTMLTTLQSWRYKPPLNRTQAGYDTHLLNRRYDSSALVLPHRPYALSTSEFRQPNHKTYLGTQNADNDTAETWDPMRILEEAKIIHFNDWPLPKPWIMWPVAGMRQMQPDCKGVRPAGKHGETCRERQIWIDLYEEFRERRERVCRILPVLAPDWALWKAAVGANGTKV